MVKLSIEELMFCFYSEGLFEQGLGLKQNYFPEMTDEQQDFAFQVSCRSLLAKEMLEYSEHSYKLKKDYAPFIKALANSRYSLNASKFESDENLQRTHSFLVTEHDIYSYCTIHDEQVHQITKLNSVEQISEELSAFFGLESIPSACEELFVLENEDFEELLKGVSENSALLEGAMAKLDLENGLVNEFMKDLLSRRGMMDSIVQFQYDKSNQPNVSDLIFVIPGKLRHWFITGSVKNKFTLRAANKEVLQRIVSGSGILTSI